MPPSPLARKPPINFSMLQTVRASRWLAPQTTNQFFYLTNCTGEPVARPPNHQSILLCYKLYGRAAGSPPNPPINSSMLQTVRASRWLAPQTTNQFFYLTNCTGEPVARPPIHQSIFLCYKLYGRAGGSPPNHQSIFLSYKLYGRAGGSPPNHQSTLRAQGPARGEKAVSAVNLGLFMGRPYKSSVPSVPLF